MKTCTINEKYIETCTSLGWGVNEYTDGDISSYIELENWSPLGENLIFTFSADNFADDVMDYADNFDPEEHAGELIKNRGNFGIPSSIRALRDDADKIEEMLIELKEALQEVEENEKDC